MPFENLNNELFQLINAPVHPASWIVLVARILAEWVVYATAVWMIAAWIWTNRWFRFVLLDAFLAAIISLSINQIIGYFFYHPRPFDLHLGHQLLAHGAETSFPSDHAVFVFSLTFTLLISTTGRNWGWIFLILGLGVSWSRVFLGVHFPFDMVGAFVVAILSVVAVRLFSSWLRANIYPLLLGFYELGISVLRLPKGIFPRSES